MSAKKHVPQLSDFAQSLLGLKSPASKHKPKSHATGGSAKRSYQAVIWDTFRRRVLPRAVCLLLLTSLLTVSTPAAPETIVGMAGKVSQDIRFAFLSSRLAIDFPTWFAAFTSSGRNMDRSDDIARIQIFPDPLLCNRDRKRFCPLSLTTVTTNH